MKYPRFENIDVRYQTFMHWKSEIDKFALLQSGFFYLGGRDSVQCYQCGIILHTWKPTDIPAIEHLKYSPSCQLHLKKTNIIDNTAMSIALLEQMQSIRDQLDKLNICLKTINYTFNAVDEVDNLL